jgi:hypothetical protein
VWLERERPSEPTSAHAKPPGSHGLVVYAASFAVSPADVRPRRLGRYPGEQPPASPWKVGCGWAAHNPARGLVLLLRLSDGEAFELRSPCTPRSWCLSSVLAVSCEELFVRGDHAHVDIARIALSAVTSH